MELQKQSVFVETDKNYVTLLLSWIYYYLSTVLDVVYNMMLRLYTPYEIHVFDVHAKYRSSTCICARKYGNFFKEYTIFYFLLIVVLKKKLIRQ